MKISHHDSLMKAELVSSSFWDLIKIRLPWLLVCLVGGLVASVIVSRFELSLRENITLAFFIPILTNVCDAVGSQTEIILVRALADLKFSVKKYVAREFLVGGTIGALLGMIAALFATFVSGNNEIGIVVGVSLFLSMSVAAGLACVTPIILKSLKFDPAVGSGPFTTALQDIVSLLIYFSVAAILLG